VLNSPGNLIACRLPYGTGKGDLFAPYTDTQYSGLFYPICSAGSAGAEYDICKPTHFTFNQDEYNSLKEGNFTWEDISCGCGTANLTATMLSAVFADPTDPSFSAYLAYITSLDSSFTVTVLAPTSAVINFDQPYSLSANYCDACFEYDPITMTSKVSAGIIILNDPQTIVNQNFEGYYVSLTDNSKIGPLTDFDSVTNIFSLTANDQYYDIPDHRLSFALSASKTFPKDSVSEAIERTQTYYFADNYYNDSLLVNVFKVYKSNNDPSTLSIQLVETHAGSLDIMKKELATSGAGVKKTFFLENVVNKNSSNISLFVNPHVSKDTLWQDLTSNNPVVAVRTLNEAEALFPYGIYQPSFNNNMDKKLGDIPTKLTRALRMVEIPETTKLDVVVDGGLSTIYTNKSVSISAFNLDSIYDDGVVYPAFTIPTDIESKWRSIFNIFSDFVSITRKDCIFISDPLRQIFITGANTKVMSKKTSNFNTEIYAHLKQSYSGVNTNYSTTYGNWVKTLDPSSDKLVWVPFSGYAASIMAKTDTVAYPWIAPAGLNRGIINNINDIAFNPNQKQRDYLYAISVNPVVYFTGDGYTVFGQKTLQNKPSAFDRINVRRLFLALEKSVIRVTKYFVFEPNTSITRSRLVSTIAPIFELAKNTEGLYDYKIVCDERNNTPTTIDNNELIVDIYLKPVRTAEFILINFIATRTSQNFEELI